MVSARTVTTARGVADACLLLVAVVLAATLLDGRLTFWLGPRLLDYTGTALWLSGVALGACAVPWRRLRSAGGDSAVALAAVLFVFAASSLILPARTHLRRSAEDQLGVRAMRRGLDDRQVLEGLFATNRNYFDEGFVSSLREAIPADAAILYLGDTRGHLLSAALYPRRVYVLPELQVAQNNAIQGAFDWTAREWDASATARPGDDTRADAPASDPQRRDRVARLVSEHDIEWFVVYDSLFPANRRWGRIGGPVE